MSWKNIAMITSAITLYFALLLYFIDPFVFLNEPLGAMSNPVWATILNFSFLLLFSLGAVSLGSNLGRILYASGIVLSATFTSLIGFFVNGNGGNLVLFLSAFVFIAFLPTAVFILSFIYFDVRDKIQVITDSFSADSANSRQILRLSNDKGKVILEVEMERIICFEANDNYVITYYLSQNNQVDKSMERISLKRIEESIHHLDKQFARVHKSYIINPDFVTKITGRSQAYKIEMEHIQKSVPVSRNFNIELLSA